MYGTTMAGTRNGVSILMRAVEESEMDELTTKAISSLQVMRYSNVPHLSHTVGDERAWLKRASEDQNAYYWGIEYEGELVGTTAVHKVHTMKPPTTGIVIWKKEVHGRGIASLAHRLRTMFIADFLGIRQVQSHVRAKNIASRMALEGVGYQVWGSEPQSVLVAGEYLDTLHLAWFNPFLVVPDAVPDMYRAAMEKARLAILEARQIVTYP